MPSPSTGGNRFGRCLFPADLRFRHDNRLDGRINLPARELATEHAPRVISSEGDLKKAGRPSSLLGPSAPSANMRRAGLTLRAAQRSPIDGMAVLLGRWITSRRLTQYDSRLKVAADDGVHLRFIPVVRCASVAPHLRAKRRRTGGVPEYLVVMGRSPGGLPRMRPPRPGFLASNV